MTDNRGNAIAYTGGTTHRPLPKADAQPYRSTHTPKTPRPTGLNWDALRPADQPAGPSKPVARQCRGCGTSTPITELRDGRCTVCADELDARFHAPDDTALGQELGRLAVVDPGVADASARLDEATLHILHKEKPCPTPSSAPAAAAAAPTTEPASTPPAPAGGSKPTSARPATSTPSASTSAPSTTTSTSPTTAAPGTLAPSTTKTVRSSASTAAASTSPDPVLDHCRQLLADTRDATDPLIRQLHTLALSALCALDLAYNPPTPLPPATPQPPPAGFTTFEKPRRRRRPLSTHSIDYLKERYEAGETCPQIAADLGTSASRIRQELAKAGVPLRDDRKGHSGSRPKSPDQDDPQLVDNVRRLYVEERLTQAEVASRLAITSKLVQNIMARHGIPARPAASVATSPLTDTPAVIEAVRRLYLDDGKSQAAIGKAYGVSQIAVSRFMRRHDIPTRPTNIHPRPSTTPTTQENPTHA